MNSSSSPTQPPPAPDMDPRLRADLVRELEEGLARWCAAQRESDLPPLSVPVTVRLRNVVVSFFGATEEVVAEWTRRAGVALQEAAAGARVLAGDLADTRGGVSAERGAAEKGVPPVTAVQCPPAEGTGCTGRMEIRQADQNLVFKLWLEDSSGHWIRPFHVTVTDDGGKVLMPRQRCEAALESPPVAVAAYRFYLEDESGERSVEMAVQPGADQGG